MHLKINLCGNGNCQDEAHRLQNINRNWSEKYNYVPDCKCRDRRITYPLMPPFASGNDRLKKQLTACTHYECQYETPRYSTYHDYLQSALLQGALVCDKQLPDRLVPHARNRKLFAGIEKSRIVVEPADMLNIDKIAFVDSQESMLRKLLFDQV